MAKLITVFGATGIQGGSVLRALLDEHDRFNVRGVTRNLKSDKAKDLIRLGVEMVQANFDEVSTLETAITGSYGVFFVTDFWDSFDHERHKQQGRNVVDVAKKLGVEHLIFSGERKTSGTSFGMVVLSFEGRADTEDYMFKSGIPSTSVRYSSYYENILDKVVPQKISEGEYVWNIPMEGKPMHMIGAQLSGPAVVTVFKNRDGYLGKVVGLSGDYRTVPEYCDVINKYIAPKKIRAGTMTAKEYGKQDFPAAKYLGVMFEFMQAGFDAGYDVEETKRLDPKTKDFDGFVRDNIETIRAVLT